MNQLLQEWVGKKIVVTLRTPQPATIEGKLHSADGNGVLVDILKGQTSVQKYVPLNSVMNIQLVPGTEVRPPMAMPG